MEAAVSWLRRRQLALATRVSGHLHPVNAGGSGLTSSTMTLRFLYASFFTNSAPMPLDPPLTTAISFGQSQVSVLLRLHRYWCNAQSFSRRLIRRMSPTAKRALSTVMTRPSATGDRRWVSFSRRDAGPRVKAKRSKPVVAGERALEERALNMMKTNARKLCHEATRTRC
jgi:hypothetical protein